MKRAPKLNVQFPLYPIRRETGSLIVNGDERRESFRKELKIEN
jgi:hypothetical protein